MNEANLMQLIWRLQHRLRDYLKQTAYELGISNEYMAVLGYLARHPGAEQKSVIESCRVSDAAVSRTITAMLREGYIRRDEIPGPERLKYLYLEPRGEQINARINARFAQTDARITQLLTPEKEAEIKAALEALEQLICGGIDA